MSRSWQDRVVENELKYHGFWHGLQLAADGASPQGTIEELSMPRGPPSKHRILVTDPPKKWWRIHRVFLLLSFDHRKALIARYSVPPRENGVMLTHKELSAILGWTPSFYAENLRAAKRSYRINVFDTV